MKFLTIASALIATGAFGDVLAQSAPHPTAHTPHTSETRAIAFSTLDANKDGKISRQEAKADADLYAEFDTLDLNHDEFLTPEEFSAWSRAVKDNTTHDPTTSPSGSNNAQHMGPT